MKMGQKLFELRSKNNQTLKQVSNKVGCTLTHISNLENGKTSNPTLQLLRNFAKHFNVSVCYLIDEDKL